MRACDHFDGVIATRTAVGMPDISIADCLAQEDGCVAMSAELARMPGSTAKACDACGLWTARADAGVEHLTCPFRGSATGREIRGSGCGCDRKIYSCDVRGLCLKRLPSGKKLEHFGKELDGVTVCKSCTVPAELLAGRKVSTETGVSGTATRQ